MICMVFNVFFTDQSLTDLSNLDHIIAKRILVKINWYVGQSNPLFFATTLKNDNIGNFRYRVGNYRIIFDVENDKIIILRIGHRSTIYRLY